jgi:tetratricopeptide (TPR) repeat protein
VDAERYRRRIEDHVLHGRFAAAIAASEAWEARDAHGVEPALARARVELAADRYRMAHDRAIAAVRERRCPPRFALEVANAMRLLVAHDELIDWVERYERWDEVPPAARARVAGSLATCGAAALAARLVDAAAADAPEDGVCLVNQALVRSHAGDFDAAERALERAIAAPDQPAMAHWMLSRLRRQTDAHNHVSRLRRRLAEASADPAYREYLHFALFKELDDLGDHAAAWDALDRGCALVRARLPYDRAGRERQFAAIRRSFADTEPVVPAGAGPVPIFIVGLHRSGTTLLESMLAAAQGVYAYGESQRLAAALRHAGDHWFPGLLDPVLLDRAAVLDQALVARRFLDAGQRLIGTARFVTEKMPGNFQLIGFIRRALPQAKIVHLRREPLDVCFANLRELFADGVDHSNAQRDLAHYHGLYSGLMAHWRERCGDAILEVDYEALVSDPHATSRRVFEYCGIDWSAEVVDPARWSRRSINTLSAVQARQPISGASIGRWRPYERWLQPLRAALEA